MSKKDELLAYLRERKINEQTIQMYWSSKEQETRKNGETDPQRVEDITAHKVSMVFRKVLNPSREEVEMEVVITAVMDESDYGASNAYHYALKQWKENRVKAVEEGYTDPAGVPIWKTSNKPKKIGTPINLEQEKSREIHCFAKRPDDSVWKDCRITLRGESLDRTLPIAKKYYRAKLGASMLQGRQSTSLSLYAIESTSFDKPMQSPIALNELIRTAGKDMLVGYPDLRRLAQSEQPLKRFFYVYADIKERRILQNSTSDILTLCDPNCAVPSLESEASSWISKEVPHDVADGAIGGYIAMSARMVTRKDDDGVETEVPDYKSYCCIFKPEDSKSDDTPMIADKSSFSEEPESKEENVDDMPW